MGFPRSAASRSWRAAMSPVSQRRSCLRTLLFWAAPLTWLGCGSGGGTDIVLPSLSVTTATDGVELDPDGYTLIIDGSDTETIGVSASVVVERLTDGPTPGPACRPRAQLLGPGRESPVGDGPLRQHHHRLLLRPVQRYQRKHRSGHLDQRLRGRPRRIHAAGRRQSMGSHPAGRNGQCCGRDPRLTQCRSRRPGRQLPGGRG